MTHLSTPGSSSSPFLISPLLDELQVLWKLSTVSTHLCCASCLDNSQDKYAPSVRGFVTESVTGANPGSAERKNNCTNHFRINQGLLVWCTRKEHFPLFLALFGHIVLLIHSVT